MSTLILRPNGPGTATISPHVPVGDTPNWRCVDESSTDGSTTYLSNAVDALVSGDQTMLDRMDMEAHTSESGTINSVTVHIRAWYATTATGTPTVAPIVRAGSTSVTGTAQNLTTVEAAYTQTWTTSPDTGVAWTWTEIDSMRAGCQTVVTGDAANMGEARVTQLWVAVDYNDAFRPEVALLSIIALQPTFVMIGGEEFVTFVFDPRGRVPPARSVKG